MDNIITLNNLNIYQMILFVIGCVFWLLTYLIYIKEIRKKQFVEIPLLVVSLNISWEFIWSFPFGSSVSKYVGTGLQVGYALWFFFDCFIFWGILKYGYKQFNNPFFRNNSKLIAILTAVLGLIFYYTFNLSGYDTQIGTISAYLDNVVISSLYIFLLISYPDKSIFSRDVSWYKMIGTGLISVALVWHWNTNYLLIFLTSLVLILDLYYIYIFQKFAKKSAS